MKRGHGEIGQVRIGEDLFAEGLDLDVRLLAPFGESILPATTSTSTAPVFNFGRMFRRPNLQEYRPGSKSLIQLGLLMEEKKDSGDHPSLPAGYTYLGQFIDHDMTFLDPALDSLSDLINARIDIETVNNMRSPSLDLDSLYGLGPELESAHSKGRKIYQADRINLRVGETAQDSLSALGVEGQFLNDLPRGDNKQMRWVASLADERNDDNLAVAQTHVSFIKFHNAVVKHLSGKVEESELFVEARKRVVQHYQWIILYDFLPKIIETEVLKDVIENGLRHFVLEEGEELFMPVEFSAAAFRMGHSLIRDKYDWNRVQSLPDHPADLSRLFQLTGFRGNNLIGNTVLPSSWIIDWTRFFDFTHLKHVKTKPQFAEKIDTSLTSPLTNLSFLNEQEKRLLSLAVRNLVRGRLFGLPAGQSVAERLNVKNPLTSKEIMGGADGPHRKVLEEHGLHILTPLWYYILKEAEVRHNGECLGPVGSRIVAETFVGLIKHSRTSILPKDAPGQPTWRPHLDQYPLLQDKQEQFFMTDLLYFVDSIFNDNHLNPLG